MNRKQGISTYPMNHLKYETCIETQTRNGFDIIWNYSEILYNMIHLCEMKILPLSSQLKLENVKMKFLKI